MGYHECPMCGYMGEFPGGTCPMCGYHNPAWKPREQTRPRRPPPPKETRRRPPPPATEGSYRQPPRSSGGSSWGWVKLAVAIVILILLFNYMSLWMPYLNKLANPDLYKPATYREYPQSAEFQFTRTYTISPSGGEVTYDFQAYYPPEIGDGGSVQDVISVDINPPPSSGTYSPGSRMVWTDTTSSPVSITLRYHAKVTAYKWDMTEDESGDVSDIPQNIREQYLGDQWAVITVDTDGDGLEDAPKDDNMDGVPDMYRIFPSNPTIKSLARQIVGNDTNVYSILKKIYIYMVDDGGFTYLTGRSGMPKTCLQTLSDRTGDCDDQSILFASLARAVGVPAWLELGWLYDSTSNSWGGHGWLNVYIPLKDGGYTIAPIDVVNKEFLFRDPYRLTEWIDDGSRGEWRNGKWVQAAISEYYYPLQYSSASGVRVSVSEDFTPGFFRPSGSIKITDDGTGEANATTGGAATPGYNTFEATVALVMAISVAMIGPHRPRHRRFS